MYAKINGGTVVKFPYTFGDLRKDNPNVSFPKNITQGVMQKYGMVGVLEGPKPDCGPYQTVKRNALPTRPVIGQDDEGNDIRANYWMIEYTAEDLTAEEIAANEASLASGNRSTRNQLLKDTDHYGLSDVAMSQEMLDYRKALRDITTHANWPNLNDADWPTKP